MPPSKVARIGNCSSGIKENYTGIIFEGLGYIYSKTFIFLNKIEKKTFYLTFFNSQFFWRISK